MSLHRVLGYYTLFTITLDTLLDIHSPKAAPKIWAGTPAVLRADECYYQDVHHHQRDFFDDAPGRDALRKECQLPTDTHLQQAPRFLSPGALAALSSDLQCFQEGNRIPHALA